MYGVFIRRMRSSRGLSQEELARTARVAQSNLSAYERDRRAPSLETLNRLAVACGYQLAATDGARVLYFPLPEVRDWYPPAPARAPGDPPDEAPVLARDATPEERGRALLELLDLADALAHGGP